VPIMEVTREEINQMIRQRQGKRSLREFSKHVGLSVAYMSDVLRGNREPGPTLLTFLKLYSVRERSIRYMRVESAAKRAK
jgi:hypothetical protein